MEDKKYTEINFQEDLVSLAKKQIEFLAFVDSENSIHVGETIDRAIYRYERFWLPFCAYQQDINNDLSKLYPPIDVAWVNLLYIYLNKLNSRLASLIFAIRRTNS